MKCSGIDALTATPVEVAFGKTIESVRPTSEAGADFLAPAWIDLQVNGVDDLPNYLNFLRTHAGDRFILARITALLDAAGLQDPIRFRPHQRR